MKVNLIELINKDIVETDGTRNLTIKGVTANHKVHRIPLEYLFYNEQNGRIATWISKYNAEKGAFNLEDTKAYNEIVHEFIKESNSTAFKKTKTNISLFGQRIAGVVLKNGRIIDGNRRFTCLRELAAEGGDYYFDAVILDTDKGISQRDIKRLELNLQHAEEEKVDYNPIDNLVDVYRDLIKEKTFTIDEYVVSVNKSPKEVKTLVSKAELMVEFLEFINAKEQYYIAREMNLDGPLQEVMGILKKTDPDFVEEVKSSLFAAIITMTGGDLTRKIREIGNKIIKTNRLEEFLEEYEEVVEEVYDTFQDKDVDLGVINKKIGGNDLLKEKSKKIVNQKVEATRLDEARNKPIDLLNKALDALEAVDVAVLNRLDEENREEFEEVLKQIEGFLELFRQKSNV